MGRQPAIAGLPAALMRAVEAVFGAGAWAPMAGQQGGLARPNFPLPGDAGLASYRAGSLIRGPLPVGTWALVVCGLDASSWAFSTSTDVAGGGDVFELEVR